MEEELESLRLSNGKLENRNNLLVRRACPHGQLLLSRVFASCWR